MSLLGEVLKGRYEIDRHAGEGGQGELYLAWDRETGGKVAVKVQQRRVFETTATYGEDRARMVAEGRIGKSLSALDGIPKVIAYGRHRKSAYLVMEFVEGKELRLLMAEKRPAHPEFAAAVTGQLCDILGRVHEKRLVHRDVKPENVIVGYDGRVRLLDFGHAVRTGKPAGRAGGTPGYSAPEQFLDDALLTPAADMFSLGATLLEMSTMRLPYQHRPERSEPFLPVDTRRLVPPAFLPLLERMLAWDPWDRPQSARAVREALRPVLPLPGARRHPQATHPDPTEYYRHPRPAD